MSTSVLISYATRSGSTREVAEAIDATLRDAGLWPDLLPMHQTMSLRGQSSVILGVPLYMGRFPKEFRQFALRHREAFATVKPWLFVLGPTRVDPSDFDAARKQAEKQLRRYPWIQPAELQVLGGRWSMDNLPFPFSVLRRLPAIKKIPASDIRDWHAIRTWALRIAQQIKPAA